MFIELVDLLRCPKPHEDSWLVATVDRMADRFITDGVLGCPVCLAEYPIRGGVVYFTETDPPPPVTSDGNHDDALRLAAALELTEARTVALLHGRWTVHAPLVRSLSPSRLLLLNPISAFSLEHGTSAIASDTVPIAPASLGAIAIDETASAAVVESLVRALRPGGRAIGPTSLTMPSGIGELVRDDDVWVGECISTPTIISLGRRAPADRSPN